MNKNQLQQGDVILRKLPQDYLNNKEYQSLKRDRRGIVLAEGETTGHYHGIECEESEAELIKIGEEMLLKVNKTVTLKHQEHKPFDIEPGIWQIGQVVEKDWLNDMVSPVRD